MGIIRRFWFLGSLLVAGLFLFSLTAETAGSSTTGVGIFPASSRPDNTVYCVADELSKIRFSFQSGQSYGPFTPKGKYSLAGLDPNNAEDITLVVDLPQSINYIGIVEFWKSKFSSQITKQPVTVKNINCTRYQVVLDKKELLNRIVNNPYDYQVHLWVRPPKNTNGVISWQVLQGNKILVEANTNIKTVGIIQKDTVMPNSFIFFPWEPNKEAPPELWDELAAFYKKIGITHVSLQYGPDGWDEDTGRKTLVQKLRSAGIKFVAQRGGGFGSITNLIDPYQIDNAYKAKGLYAAAKELNEKMFTEERPSFAKIADYVDGCVFDYEPGGPGAFPGYNDPETIKAFCREKKLGELSPEAVKAQYAKEYLDFRMQLMSEPIIALKKMTNSVKPGIPLFICQGAGLPVGNHIDPKAYDKATDYHLPMIYTDALSFYAGTKAMAEYVDRSKLIPIDLITAEYINWTAPYGRLLLDYIATASLGTGGYSTWTHAADYDGGQFFEVYLAGKMLAPVEEFYRQGKLTQEVVSRGLPYLEKKINVGTMSLDLSQPDWKSNLVAKAHSYGGETAVTLLNFHNSEDVFVEIRYPSCAKAQYVVNLANGTYLTIAEKSLLTPAELKKGIVVQVPTNNPAIWIITDRTERLKRLKPLAMEPIFNEYQTRKAAADKKTAPLPVGKKGNLSVNYAQVKESDGKSNICLEVSSPVQTISFLSSGGRIWKWVVNENDVVVRSYVQGGVGMDMFWIPALGRWNGDQTNEMALAKVENTGKEVIVRYKGIQPTLKIQIEKTYRIPSDKSSVKVNVRLTNCDAVNPGPLVVSYWSHNFFGEPGMKGSDRLFLFAGTTETSIIPMSKMSDITLENINNKGRYKDILMPGNLAGVSRNVFGEYFPKKNLGILFRLPDDFLQIYRWQSSGTNDATLEWMQRPVKITYRGPSSEFSYEMELLPLTPLEQFKKTIQNTVI